MNVQPKLSRPEDRPIVAQARIPAQARNGREHHLPGGSRAYATWPVEFEVEPWRP